MFVDASAIIAILAEEPEGESFAGQLQTVPAGDRITSVIAVWEAVAGLCRALGVPISESEIRVRGFLHTAQVRVQPLTLEHLTAALYAFERYGRHQYLEKDRNKALNLGDCFHYACARIAGTDILHKDVGLAATDLSGVSPTA